MNCSKGIEKEQGWGVSEKTDRKKHMKTNKVVVLEEVLCETEEELRKQIVLWTEEKQKENIYIYIKREQPACNRLVFLCVFWLSPLHSGLLCKHPSERNISSSNLPFVPALKLAKKSQQTDEGYNDQLRDFLFSL